MAYTVVDPADKTSISAAVTGEKVGRRITEQAIEPGKAAPDRLEP